MNPHFPILLVEDDEQDIFFAKRAFRQASLRNPLRVVRDGEQAIAYLRGEGKYFDRQKYPLPMLVIMGFNMPRKTGLEVLAWIRKHDEFKELAIVMLSPASPQVEPEVQQARRLGITAHLTKAPDSRELQHVYKMVVNHWNLLNVRARAESGVGQTTLGSWLRSPKDRLGEKPCSGFNQLIGGVI